MKDGLFGLQRRAESGDASRTNSQARKRDRSGEAGDGGVVEREEEGEVKEGVAEGLGGGGRGGGGVGSEGGGVEGPMSGGGL